MPRHIFAMILAVLLGLSIYYICISDTAIRKKENIYLLKEYENSVALYHNQEIIEIYNTVIVSSLPEYDQVSLRKGIKLDSPADAAQYIEDFDG